MAGRGPAPKDPSARRRRTAPLRGEWTDLPEKSGVKRPALPRFRGKGGWPAECKMAWDAWWSDPAASQWTPADRVSVYRLLDLLWQSSVKLSVNAEVRLRMDGLGLSPKGKRDLRWRVNTDPAHADGPAPDELAARRKRRDRVKATDAVAGS